MKTNNDNSFLLAECNASLVASSRFVSHGTSFLNRWMNINRCGRQTIKQVANHNAYKLVTYPRANANRSGSAAYLMQ
jgi:hypothetical protein